MHRLTRVVAAAFSLVSFAVSTGAAHAKTAKECNDEYAANKAALQAAGQTKKDFISACWAGKEKVPSTTAATPSPAAAAPAAAAPNAR